MQRAVRGPGCTLTMMRRADLTMSREGCASPYTWAASCSNALVRSDRDMLPLCRWAAAAHAPCHEAHVSVHGAACKPALSSLCLTAHAQGGGAPRRWMSCGGVQSGACCCGTHLCLRWSGGCQGLPAVAAFQVCCRLLAWQLRGVQSVLTGSSITVASSLSRASSL